MTKTIDERVRELIASHFVTDFDKLTPNTRFIEDLGGDSLDLIDISLHLEDAFGITVHDRDADKIRTIDAAVSYVEKALELEAA